MASQNPALVKRNVLASFTSLLLLPVTIVPRTVGVVGEALITGRSAAVQGIAMLNPQRWGPGGVTNGKNSYSTNLEKDGRMLFEADEDDEEKEKPLGTFYLYRCANKLMSDFQNLRRNLILVCPRRHPMIALMARTYNNSSIFYYRLTWLLSSSTLIVSR